MREVQSQHTYQHARVPNHAVSLLKSGNVLAHLDDLAYDLMSWNELHIGCVSSGYIQTRDDTYGERCDKLSVVDMLVGAAHAYVRPSDSARSASYAVTCRTL